MGKMKVVRRDLTKKTPISPPFTNIYIVYEYINLIIQMSFFIEFVNFYDLS